MLGKVSLSALFASLRLNGPLERNRRPRMTFGPLRPSDFRLRRAAPFRGYYRARAVRRPQRGFPLLLWRRGGSTRAPRRAGRPIGTPDSFKQPGGAGNPKVEGRRPKPEARRGARFFRGRRFLSSGPFNRRDAKSAERETFPSIFSLHCYSQSCSQAARNPCATPKDRIMARQNHK